MTRTSDVLALVVSELTGATSAGANVFSPLNFPTWNNSYPVLFVRTPKEHKEGFGPNGAPQFMTTALVVIEARVQLPAESSNEPFDSAAAAVEAALSLLSTQIEVALINNPSLMAPNGPVQEFPSIVTDQTVTAAGEQHLGNLVSEISIKFYQGPEDFFQPVTFEITELTTTTDLVNVFDATGTYVNPPFPSAVVPAPRDEGPDGRAEGYATFNPNP